MTTMEVAALIAATAYAVDRLRELSHYSQVRRYMSARATAEEAAARKFDREAQPQDWTRAFGKILDDRDKSTVKKEAPREV